MSRKTYFQGLLASLTLVTLALSCTSPEQPYRTVTVEAPFAMNPIKEYIFPDRDYLITDYGAKADSLTINTARIAAAISDCHKAGGGRVIIPAGVWLTGPIHLQSNVCLHLEEGAVLSFTDNPDDYLPAVMTSWEGMECYNYSPLVYAFGCENVAITGSGTLAPQMGTWSQWFDRTQPHLDALKELYEKASTGKPVDSRQMAQGEYHLRPHLIQFNRCDNVLLDGFKIRESPFWTIHIYLCNGCIARNLDVSAHGFNSDGIDIEMTKNVLIEDCIFDQNDDGVVIKSGRNHDAWRINVPTENVVVRGCKIRRAHSLLGVGSEISGGVRNIYMHHCEVCDTVFRLFYVKTNHRRGAFVENVRMENIRAGRMQRVMEVDADVLYQWRDLVPTYKDTVTAIRGLYMDSIFCDRTEMIYDLKGDERLPIRDVKLTDIFVGEVTECEGRVENAEDIVIDGGAY